MLQLDEIEKFVATCGKVLFLQAHNHAFSECFAMKFTLKVDFRRVYFTHNKVRFLEGGGSSAPARKIVWAVYRHHQPKLGSFRSGWYNNR